MLNIYGYISVNGGYSEYKNCTAPCSKLGDGNPANVTCYRYCTNPEPTNGGSNCSNLGPDFNVTLCPGNKI